MHHVQESLPRPDHSDRPALQLMASYQQLRTVRCQAREKTISIDANAVESEMRRSGKQDPIATVNSDQSSFHSSLEVNHNTGTQRAIRRQFICVWVRCFTSRALRKID